MMCTLEIQQHKCTSIRIAGCTCKLTLWRSVGLLCRRAWSMELQLAVQRKKERALRPCVYWASCADLSRAIDREFGILWVMISRRGLGYPNRGTQRRVGDSDMYMYRTFPLRMTQKIPTTSPWSTSSVLLKVNFWYHLRRPTDRYSKIHWHK